MNEQETALRAQLVELQAENAALIAQLEGRIPDATYWLQRKVWQQRRALDVLNRRVVTQRFVLRTLQQLGRELSPEEWRTARDAERPELQERIAEPV
jgi:hypothetical protein